MLDISEDEKAVIRMTVKQEAADQPYLGQLGVAYVILNRMEMQAKTAYEICWQPYQFSCWLTKLNAVAIWLKAQPKPLDNDIHNAVNAAVTGSVADPTFGATHYINMELTKATNFGQLPAWVNTMRVTVIIGQHMFLKAK